MLDQRQMTDLKPLIRQTSPLPSTTFDFSTSEHGCLFGLSGSGVTGPEFSFPTEEKQQQDSVQFPDATRASGNVPYSPTGSPTSGNDGIVPSLRDIESSGSLQQLLPFIYPSYDPSASRNNSILT